jgi:DNA modification methylase
VPPTLCSPGALFALGFGGGGEWGEGINNFDCHVSATPQSNFNAENMKQHPAQKSIEVMKWLVNAATSKGELVADPFSGSGTTGIAANQLGRSFHGVEINKEFIELANKRIAAYG